MIGIDELNARIEAIVPEVAAFRHSLHRIPELAGDEWKTSEAIRARLAPLNLEVEKPFLKTDVIAFLNRDRKPNLTLRADMDALPLEESDKECPYCSLHPGRMHACGHDGHVAMLYGAAKILSECREEVPCSVRFLFQPGEEMACMARALLESGALDHPEPDFITGLHIWPGELRGRICTKPGVLMAAAGFFPDCSAGQGGTRQSAGSGEKPHRLCGGHHDRIPGGGSVRLCSDILLLSCGAEQHGDSGTHGTGGDDPLYRSGKGNPVAGGL